MSYTIPCNFYKRKAGNPYNVVITADIWDRDEAERTQGTLELDGKVVEWYLVSWFDPTTDMRRLNANGEEMIETAIVVNGEEITSGDVTNEKKSICFAISDALAERHCPETSDARIGADYGDEGCCPICKARHELAVYDVLQPLRKAGLRLA